MVLMLWYISLLEIIALIYLERKLFRAKIMSPVLFLGAPFLVVSLMAICFGSLLEFVPLKFELFFIWWIGILFVWFGGMYSNFLIPIKYRVYKNVLFDDRKYKRISMIVTIIISSSILVRSYNLFWGSSVHVLASNNFSAVIGEGAYGWLRILLLISLTYLLCTFKLRKTSLIEVIAIILGIVTVMIYQIKGVTLLPLLTCVLYRLLNGESIFSIKVILSSVMVAVVVFYAAYSLPYLLSGDYSVLTDPVFYNYILLKITKYVWAGILACSELLNTNIEPSEPWYIIISPIYNVFIRLLGGDSVAPETSYYVPISNSFDSNVFTIFGTIYFFTNYFGLISISFIIGFFAYLSLKLSISNPENYWYKLAYAMVLFYLTMGVFDYFFYHSYVLIMLFLIYLIGFKAEIRFKISTQSYRFGGN